MQLRIPKAWKFQLWISRGATAIANCRIQTHDRGGEWYPENSGSRKFLFQSRNLGGILNESRNLVYLYFFASRIIEFSLAARSRSLRFLFFDQRFLSKP